MEQEAGASADTQADNVSRTGPGEGREARGHDSEDTGQASAGTADSNEEDGATRPAKGVQNNKRKGKHHAPRAVADQGGPKRMQENQEEGGKMSGREDTGENTEP